MAERISDRTDSLELSHEQARLQYEAWQSLLESADAALEAHGSVVKSFESLFPPDGDPPPPPSARAGPGWEVRPLGVEEALDALARGALLDVPWPGGPLHDLARHARNRARRARADRDEAFARACDDVADAVLAEPFELDSLESTLRRLHVEHKIAEPDGSESEATSSLSAGESAILERLRAEKGEPVKGAVLETVATSSRELIRRLKAKGYHIENVKGSGYRLLER